MESYRENVLVRLSVKIEQLSKESGMRIANVFHAGDGNLHPLIMFDGTQDGALHRRASCGTAFTNLY